MKRKFKLFLLSSCFLLKTFSCSAGWELPATNLSIVGQDASEPEIAMDSSGNGIAVWLRFDGANNRIQARRYDQATDTWQAVIDLSAAAAGQNAYDPQIAMDSAGNGIAVWRRYNGADYIVQARRYDVDSDIWEAVEDLSAAGQDSYLPDVAMDSASNAIAVWQFGPTPIVQTRMYDVDSGTWQVAINLSAEGGDARAPKVAMSPAGNGVVVWYRGNGSNDIVQATLFFGPLLAPANLSACKKSHRFPTQIDLIHCLAWDAVTDAAKYRVYFDNGLTGFVDPAQTTYLGVLVGEVALSDNPSLEYHGRCTSGGTYNVVAVDSNDDNGLPASVTI